MRTVGGEAPIEAVEPLCINESLQESHHLVFAVTASEGTKEAKLPHLADVILDLVEELGFVCRVLQKMTKHLNKLVAPEDHAPVAATAIGLDKLLPQEHEKEANGIAQRPTRNEAREFYFTFVEGSLTEERIALRLVDLQLETQQGDMVAHARLQREKMLPVALIVVAPKNASHQRDENGREGITYFGGLCHGLPGEDYQRHEGGARPALRVLPRHWLGGAFVDHGLSIFRCDGKVAYQLGKAVLKRVRSNDVGQ